jgi:hypothetical protein
MEKLPYNTPEWKQWLADKKAGKQPMLPPGTIRALPSPLETIAR